MTRVLDESVLVCEAVVHLLSDVALVLRELVVRVAFDPFDFGALPLQLLVKFTDEVSLHLLALLLLLRDAVLDLFGVSGKVVQDGALVLHAVVALSVQVSDILSYLLLNWCD